MVDFKKMFRPDPDHTKWPGSIEYKSKKIIPFDRFPVKDKETLVFSIEQTSSTFVQGFSVGIFDGYLKTDRFKTNKRKFFNTLFWEDAQGYDPKNIEVKIFTKGDHITICNIWEIEVTGYHGTRWKEWGDGVTETGFFEYDKPKKEPCYYGSRHWMASKGNGVAMYAEDIPNGKRYFCNDGDEDDDFNDIVFTVKRVSS